MKHLRMPRLLPVTIFAMALSLGAKCVGLAGAAAKEAQSAIPDAPTAVHAGAPAAKSAPQPAAVPFAPPPPSAPAQPAPQQPRPENPAARHADLDAQEAALRQRQSVIAAADQKLEQRIAELKALQAQLEKEQAGRNAAEERHWDNLVQLYQRMKPREAARILDGMDTTVVVALIARMKQLRAAPILAAMSPERARDVTSGLAQHQAEGAGPTQ